MPFSNNLNLPVRTMLTSEKGMCRISHIIEDFKTKRLRALAPIETERIDGFPYNLTNTETNDKKRFFMIGSTLAIGVIERIGKEIKNIIKQEEFFLFFNKNIYKYFKWLYRCKKNNDMKSLFS